MARWSPSVTVAAIVEERDARGSRYLLVEERTPEGLRLNNPAGHLEPRETPLQGVLRETLEETARIFVPEAIVGIYLWRAPQAASARELTFLRIAFAGRVGPEQPGRSLDREIVRTLWLTAEEIAEQGARLRSPLVLRGIEDLRAGRRFPLDLIRSDLSLAPGGIGP